MFHFFKFSKNMQGALRGFKGTSTYTRYLCGTIVWSFRLPCQEPRVRHSATFASAISQKMKGAVGGLKPPWFLQGTYLECFFGAFKASISGTNLWNLDFFLSSFPFSPKETYVSEGFPGKRINWIELQNPHASYIWNSLHIYRRLSVALPHKAYMFRFNTPTKNTFPAPDIHTCLMLRG